MKMLRRTFVILITALSFLRGEAAAQDMAIDDFFKLVQTGSVGDVALALERQPSLATQRDQYGFSAVHMLDYNGFDEKLSLLQRFGADINAQNDAGHALLHIIIAPEFIPAAVAAGGDVNLKDKMGRTPVMLHLREPDGPDFVPALIAAGAELNVRDIKGESLLDYAAEFENPALTDMLIDAGATP